jgi:RNA 3'-terminal phosphate cyclase
MATINQMASRTRKFERMTLAQIKSIVQKSRVDTSIAVAQAAQMERVFLPGQTSREIKIAVFLSGLMANLVDGD